MNNRKSRKNRKEKLIQQIAQQRQTLSLQKTGWIRRTAPIDRGWKSLYQWRAFIVPGIGIAVLYAMKSKPQRLIMWPRRAIAAWGAMKFIRQRLPLLRYLDKRLD